jgi:hypothetical protein
VDYRQHLRPGERAVVMCLACDRAQARIVQRYIAGYFREIPLLQPLAIRENDDGLELENGVDIVVAPNSCRSVRGRTVVYCIFDEVAFGVMITLRTLTVATYNALRPSLITLPGAMLIGISTPYRRSGLLFNRWRRHFGKPGDDVLVVHARKPPPPAPASAPRSRPAAAPDR